MKRKGDIRDNPSFEMSDKRGCSSYMSDPKLVPRVEQVRWHYCVADGIGVTNSHFPLLCSPPSLVCSTSQLASGIGLYTRWRLVLYFPDTEFHTFFPDKSRYHRIFTLSGLFRTCQAPDSAAEVDPIAHFGHFRSHLATCTWQQINSKIVAIDQCHSVIASISELLSILVCFIYQIIPLQSLL